jgi:hypothetical protein
VRALRLDSLVEPVTAFDSAGERVRAARAARRLAMVRDLFRDSLGVSAPVLGAVLDSADWRAGGAIARGRPYGLPHAHHGLAVVPGAPAGGVVFAQCVATVLPPVVRAVLRQQGLEHAAGCERDVELIAAHEAGVAFPAGRPGPRPTPGAVLDPLERIAPGFRAWVDARHTAAAPPALLAPPLVTGETVERALPAGETHAYTLSLQTGQTAWLTVRQHGADVVLSARRPDGRPAGSADSPGATGTDELAVVADTSGTYRVEVRAWEGEPTRPYRLRLDRVVTPENAAAHDAERRATRRRVRSELAARYEAARAAVARGDAVAYRAAYGRPDSAAAAGAAVRSAWEYATVGGRLYAHTIALDSVLARGDSTASVVVGELTRWANGSPGQPSHRRETHVLAYHDWTRAADAPGGWRLVGVTRLAEETRFDGRPHLLPPSSRPGPFGPSSDSTFVAELERDGTSVTRGRATVWSPRDSLTPHAASALADSIDRGVAALTAALGGSQPWQRLPDAHVTFYLYPSRFVSHASPGGARVFIPLANVRRPGAGPYLHEAAHVLTERTRLDAPTGARFAELPLWLSEGFPSYIASVANARVGFAQTWELPSGPWTADNALVDASCARHLGTRAGGRVLPYIGADAYPPELFTAARRDVVVPYYECAQSFVHFLARTVGRPALVAAVGAPDAAAALEVAARRPLVALRAEWRAGLGRSPAESRTAAPTDAP